MKRKFELFDFCVYTFLLLAALICIYPLVYIVAVSFSSSRAVMSNEVMLWPVDFNTDAYQSIIADGALLHALSNTIILTVGGTLLNMVGTVMIAYPLSRPGLRGKKIFSKLIVFTMMFNGGLIPTFLLVHQMKLTNHYLGVWLVTFVSTYNMFVMKSFFEGIPESLVESARIDGASNVTTLLRIVLPLSKPVLATLTLFYAVGHWNSYFNEMIYLTSSEKLPIMVKLMQMVKEASPALLQNDNILMQETLTPEAIRAAAIVVSTVPIMCFYPFVQKYFVKGVMLGAVKG